MDLALIFVLGVICISDILIMLYILGIISMQHSIAVKVKLLEDKLEKINSYYLKNFK